MLTVTNLSKFFCEQTEDPDNQNDFFNINRWMKIGQ